MRKPQTVAFWTRRLPHWEVEEGRYFVTIHLAGAIPRSGSERIQEIASQLRRLDQKEGEQYVRLQRRVFAEMEHWLDRARHVTHLERPEVAKMVAEAIAHRSRSGVWRMFEYVLMPNHVHLFFDLLQTGLKRAVENFKGWTGRRATSLIGLEQEHFWQREWFDHWSRSDEQDERIAAYIRRNPVKAGLVNDYHDWPYGSWAEKSQ